MTPSGGDGGRKPGRRAPGGIRAWLDRARFFTEEFYSSPYRATIARARRDEDDLFMLLVFSEMMGVPNPATYYTLELQPLLLERFHDWHRRMGMPHSPLDHFRCC
jgi:hypothetical protein